MFAGENKAVVYDTYRSNPAGCFVSDEVVQLLGKKGVNIRIRMGLGRYSGEVTGMLAEFVELFDEKKHSKYADVMRFFEYDAKIKDEERPY